MTVTVVYDTARLHEKAGQCLSLKEELHALLHNAHNIVMSDHHLSMLTSNAKSGLTSSIVPFSSCSANPKQSDIWPMYSMRHAAHNNPKYTDQLRRFFEDSLQHQLPMLGVTCQVVHSGCDRS